MFVLVSAYVHVWVDTCGTLLVASAQQGCVWRGREGRGGQWGDILVLPLLYSYHPLKSYVDVCTMGTLCVLMECTYSSSIDSYAEV